MFTLRLLGSASLDGPDGPVSGRAALRPRMALLAFLAVEYPRPVSRDKLVAYVWPESDSDDARRHLRDALYILRSALGDDSVLSTGDDLRLNPERLACDLWWFEGALARGDLEGAVAEYGGPFLSGFHHSGADEFERWAEAQRSRLGARFGKALEHLAQGAMASGDPVRAAEWLSLLAGEDPYNSRIALRYMQALEAAGDRAGALRHAKAHSDLLRTELDAVPEPEVLVLAEKLRLDSGAAFGEVPRAGQSSPAIPAPVAAGRQELSLSPTGAKSPGPARGKWVAPALVVGTVVGLGLVGAVLSRREPPALAQRRVAAAPFENRTGRPDLDDLGDMAADWIIRGLTETPIVDATDLEAVYAGTGRDPVGPVMDPRTLARRSGAGIVVAGSYYRSGDSVLFDALLIDVPSGRVLRSFDPVGAPLRRAADALEVLRGRVAAGLSPLVNTLDRGFPVNPDLVVPPDLSAYREFVAGLRQGRLFSDWQIEAQHYRRAATLDSTFVAPLIQLAYGAWKRDQCTLTDSVRSVLNPRRERLTPWDRMTMDLLMARCLGDMTRAVTLLEERFRAYPRARSGQTHLAWGLQHANRPRAARAVLSRLVPERDLGWVVSPDEAEPRYWKYVAASWHMLEGYHTELEITDHWRDSSTQEWREIRGRALAGLGREGEALELLRGMLAGSIESAEEPALGMATEFAAHGHPRAARVMAESVLLRLVVGPDTGWSRALSIAWANRLLGRAVPERQALELVLRSDADTTTRLAAQARLAVLLGDTAEAVRLDGILAELSSRPLRNPWVRGAQILARAHIAAGYGRRERAVALLREASARGMVYFGSSHAYHADLLLVFLQGYAPFEALLRPDE